ncbi:MAG TPA: AI-2E family transporter [Roseiarcus sp.]|nr:AI-2E family transporter [Roseiarcus sp.]
MNARIDNEPSATLVEAALWIGVTLGLGLILTLARDVLVPLALATLLSFALSPLVRALQKLGAPRPLGVAAALAIFAAAIGLWIWFVSGQVSDLATRLPAYSHNIHEKLHALTQRFGGAHTSGFMGVIEDAAKEIAPSEVPGAGAAQRVVIVDASALSRIGSLGASASPVLSPIAQALVIVVFTAFLLAQKEDLRNRLIKLMGANDINRTTEAIDDAGRRIGRMLFAQLLMNSAFGLVVALALWAIGVPNPGLFGTLAGVARFAPYVGVLIGVAPALVVAFAFDPGWSAVLLTLLLFVAVEGLTGQIIEPLVYGHSSGLSPAALVVTTALWAFLWGPIGLLLATPLTTCVVVLGRHAPGLAFLETLLGNEPPLTAQETFYQRMLAGDPREAAAQARLWLKRDAIAEYYDEVALEALRRAHLDVARGDLDAGRLAALTRSTQQLVAELVASGAGRAPRLRALLRRLSHFGAGEAEAGQEGPPRSPRFVAVLHGDHPLDPLAAAMLSHALNRRGLPSRIVTAEQARMATATECASVGLVCLCYIEPLTIAHLRAAATAARRYCPQAKVILCVWRDPADNSFHSLERKLRCDAAVTGIAEAVVAARRLLGLRSTFWSQDAVRRAEAA